MKYFVTAIGTDSGKTIVSAILCEALEVDYWKPIQAGLPKDIDVVKSLVSNKITVFHQGTFVLSQPASPHMAARIDGIEIKVDELQIPITERDLIIEGAGGLMVPINDSEFMIDLVKSWSVSVVLVCDLYLGSINHSLLTIDKLKAENIHVQGIIFNGESNPDSEKVILNYSGWQCLLRINKEKKITRKLVAEYAIKLKSNWNNE